MLISNPALAQLLCSKLSCAQPCTNTAFKDFVNRLIISATVQTILFVCTFAWTVTFEIARVSEFFLVIVLKYAAAIKYNDNETRTVFASHLVDLFQKETGQLCLVTESI